MDDLDTRAATPLHYALRAPGCTASTVRILLEAGMNPISRDENGTTPLDDALKYAETHPLSSEVPTILSMLRCGQAGRTDGVMGPHHQDVPVKESEGELRGAEKTQRAHEEELKSALWETRRNSAQKRTAKLMAVDMVHRLLIDPIDGSVRRIN